MLLKDQVRLRTSFLATWRTAEIARQFQGCGKDGSPCGMPGGENVW